MPTTQTITTPTPIDTPAYYREHAGRARARASRPNQHAIGGDAPEDTGARISTASDRIRLLGIAAEAIAHAESDLGLPDGEAWRTLGGMLQELAEDIVVAQCIAVAQDWEQQPEGGR